MELRLAVVLALAGITCGEYLPGGAIWCASWGSTDLGRVTSVVAARHAEHRCPAAVVAGGD